MTIELSPELEAKIRQAAAEAEYASADEYVAAALAVFGAFQESGLDMLDHEDLRLLDESIAQADRGELTDGDTVRRRCAR